MNTSTMLYIVIAIVVINLIRLLPMVLIKGEIHSTFLRSFLYYVPYVTLAVMTFPAIVETTQVAWAGIAALIAGIIAAILGAGLFGVASLCCITVLIIEYIANI